MKEDIKILEEWLIQLNELFEKTKINNTKERKSLENLIKGYRELEKDLHEMTISNNHKKENWIHKNCLNDYIRKSKIKEKIEDLNNYKSEFCQRVINHNEHTLTGFVQNILQELMEDK